MVSSFFKKYGGLSLVLALTLGVSSSFLVSPRHLNANIIVPGSSTNTNTSSGFDSSPTTLQPAITSQTSNSGSNSGASAASQDPINSPILQSGGNSDSPLSYDSLTDPNSALLNSDTSGASSGCGATNSIFPNPLSNCGTICTFLVGLLNIITEIGAIIGVLVLIGCGFFFIYAQGNKEKLDTAKRAFLMSILGIVLLLGASVLAHVIITAVNSVLSAGGGQFSNQSALTCSP